MDPTLIRPAVVLRMPNFHMSSDEASKLVDYFAAKSELGVPVRVQRASSQRLPGRARADAPGAAERCDEDRHERQLLREVPLGRRLPGAGRRPKTLRPELGRGLSPLAAGLLAALDRQSAAHLAVHRHAGEHTVRPGTAELGRRQPGLFPGPSIPQLDGVVDLLMNFDEYTRRQTSVKGLVKEPRRRQPPAAASRRSGRTAQR